MCELPVVMVHAAFAATSAPTTPGVPGLLSARGFGSLLGDIRTIDQLDEVGLCGGDISTAEHFSGHPGGLALGIRGTGRGGPVAPSVVSCWYRRSHADHCSHLSSEHLGFSSAMVEVTMTAQKRSCFTTGGTSRRRGSSAVSAAHLSGPAGISNAAATSPYGKAVNRRLRPPL